MSTEDQRRQHVEAWQKSGLSRSAYSRQHGLHPTTFSAWVRQASVVEGPVPSLVPVEVQRADAPSAAWLVVRLTGGTQIEMSAAVSARWLAELLQCLG